MDAYGTARLAAKEAESAIVARICEDFNLTPVLARAHYEQMARYFADCGLAMSSQLLDEGGCEPLLVLETKIAKLVKKAAS
jgi:hypothetical protein